MMRYRDLMNKVFEIKETLGEQEKKIIEIMMAQYSKALNEIKYINTRIEEIPELYKKMDKMKIENEKLDKENQILYTKNQALEVKIYKMQQLLSNNKI